MNKFKVGDLVVVHSSENNNGPLFGCLGVLLEVDKNQDQTWNTKHKVLLEDGTLVHRYQYELKEIK